MSKNETKQMFTFEADKHLVEKYRTACKKIGVHYYFHLVKAMEDFVKRQSTA